MKSELKVLHEPYKETSELMQAYRRLRDRQFYLTVAVMEVVLFDIYSAGISLGVLANALKKSLDTATTQNVARKSVWPNEVNACHDGFTAA